VLRPGGRYLFNVWDRLEHNQVSELVARAVARLFPDDPPRFFERTPFGYFDTADIHQQLREVGFEDVEIETAQKVSRAPSAELVAIDLCQGTPLRGECAASARRDRGARCRSPYGSHRGSSGRPQRALR